MKITYCVYDDKPAILVRPGDGRILGFQYVAGNWKVGNGDTLEIVTEGRVMPEEAFKKWWPDIGLPEDMTK
jgi:hypothetical protein